MYPTYLTIYNELTCTVDPISSVARVAGTGETPLCVRALCILMTVVQVITLTLIDICAEHSKSLTTVQKNSWPVICGNVPVQ